MWVDGAKADLGLSLGNLAWSFPSRTEYFTHRHFSYLHGNVKLCINVHWINKDSVEPVYSACKYQHFTNSSSYISKSCWIAAACLTYCINIHSAGRAEGLLFWWQTINRTIEPSTEWAQLNLFPSLLDDLLHVEPGKPTDSIPLSCFQP